MKNYIPIQELKLVLSHDTDIKRVLKFEERIECHKAISFRFKHDFNKHYEFSDKFYKKLIRLIKKIKKEKNE